MESSIRILVVARLPHFSSYLLMQIFFAFWASALADDRLCRSAMHTLLGAVPHADTADSLVAALVQLDSTFGITPCEYNKMKGIKSSGLNDASDFDNKYQEVGAVENDASRALAAMSDASDSAVYSQPKSESAAKRAGKMVGGGISYGATHIGQGLSAGIKGIGTGISEVARSIGIPDVDINLDVFKAIDWKVGGEWALKGGEGLYDVTTEGLKNVYDFYSGIAAGIFPSAAGRRRVVYDKDCDNIQNEIDAIENKCNSYRYDKLTQMFPVLQSANALYFGVSFNTTRLNQTFEGDPLSFTPGVKEVFQKHKDALYGIGGDCLTPTRGSLSKESSVLTYKAFEQWQNDLQAVMQTDWENLKNIDKGTKAQIEAVVQGFKNVSLDQLNMSSVVGSLATGSYYQNVVSLITGTASLLGNLTAQTNRLQEQQNSNFESISNRSTKAENAIQRAVTRLINQLGSVSDTLYNTDALRAEFTDSLVEGVREQLAAGAGEANQMARDQTSVAVNAQSGKLLNVFKTNLEGAVSQTGRSWGTTVQTLMIDKRTDYQRTFQKEVGVNRALVQNFDAAETLTMSDLADLATNNTIKFQASQAAALDASASTKLVSTQTDSTGSTFVKLYAALDGNAGETIADAQTKIGNAIAEAGNGASEQLAQLGSSYADAAQDVTEMTSEMKEKFTALAARVSGAIGRSAAAATKSSQSELLNTASQLGASQIQVNADFQSNQLAAAGAKWQQLGDAALAELESVVGESEEDRAGAIRDASSALRAGQGDMSEIEFEEKSAGAVGRRNMIAAGNAAAALARGESADLAIQRDQLAGLLQYLSSVRQGAGSSADSTQQTRLAAKSLVKAIEGAEESYAGAFKQTSTAAAAQLDKASSEVDSRKEGAVAELEARLASLGTSMKNQHTSSTISMEDLVSELASVGEPYSNTKELASDLASTFAQSQSRAAGVVAGFSDSASNLESEISRAAQSVVPPARMTTSFVSPPPQSVAISNSIDAARSALSAALSSAALATTELDQGESKAIAEFDSDSAAMSNTQSSLNAQASWQITNMTDTFTRWNSSQPKIVSASVENFIEALGADGMRLMDRIAQEAGFGVSGFLSNFSSDSVNSLDQLGAVSERFLQEAAQPVTAPASLQGLSNQISEAKKFLSQQSSASLNEYMQASLLGAADRDATRLTAALKASAQAANSSLFLDSARGGSEAGFAANISSGQASALSRLGAQAASAADALTGEASVGLGTQLAASTDRLQTLESSMQTYATRLESRMQNVLSHSGDDEFIANISSDKSQLAVQMLMTRRSVRDLLETWDKYTTAETEKFGKMNLTDFEYLAAMSGRLDSANSTSGGALRIGQASLGASTAEILAAASNYIQFRNFMQSGVANYRDALRVLNVSATAAISQTKESIFNLNANDDFVDGSSKSQLLAAVQRFETELDQKALQAEQSVGIQ